MYTYAYMLTCGTPMYLALRTNTLHLIGCPHPITHIPNVVFLCLQVLAVVILTLYVAYLGNMDLLDFQLSSEDSKLDSPGEESATCLQFTDASESDLVDVSVSMNDSLYVPTPERNFKIKLCGVKSRKWLSWTWLN